MMKSPEFPYLPEPLSEIGLRQIAVDIACRPTGRLIGSSVVIHSEYDETVLQGLRIVAAGVQDDVHGLTRAQALEYLTNGET